MHPLLEPSTPERALAGCERFLAARWGRLVLARRLLRGNERADVVALLAWRCICADLAAKGGDDPLDEAERELDRVLGGGARSAAGSLLAQAVHRHRLPEPELRHALAAERRARHVHAFSTEDELVQCARNLAVPSAHLLLRVVELSGERERALADALATGLQLAAWIVGFDDELEAGRIALPFELLRRHGVDPRALAERAAGPGLEAAFARWVDRTRLELAKGWPLCAILGPRRGRALAFALRWQAAALAAFELRGADPFRGLPPGGRLRALACGAAVVGAPYASPWERS